MRDWLPSLVTGGACLAAVCLFTVPCGAQQAAAEAMFQEGRVFFESGRIADACQRYEASLELEPAVGTLLHLGDCYDRMGRVASAWATFEKARSMAAATGQDARVEMAKTRASELEPKLPKLELRLAPEARVPGLAVTVGGVAVPVSSNTVTLPFDPGSHAISATAPGHQPWSSTIKLEPGALKVVAIPALVPSNTDSAAPAPAPPPPSTPTAATDAPSSGSAQRVAGIVLGSVGIAGLAAGTVFGFRAQSKNDSSLDECRPQDETRCNARGVELREEAKDNALVSTIALSAGGGLAITGLVLLLTAPSTRERPPPAARFVPAIGPGVATASVWGSF